MCRRLKGSQAFEKCDLSIVKVAEIGPEDARKPVLSQRVNFVRDVDDGGAFDGGDSILGWDVSEDAGEDS